jgi:hypothetical protein
MLFFKGSMFEVIEGCIHVSFRQPTSIRLRIGTGTLTTISRGTERTREFRRIPISRSSPPASCIAPVVYSRSSYV